MTYTPSFIIHQRDNYLMNTETCPLSSGCWD